MVRRKEKRRQGEKVLNSFKQILCLLVLSIFSVDTLMLFFYFLNADVKRPLQSQSFSLSFLLFLFLSPTWTNQVYYRLRIVFTGFPNGLVERMCKNLINADNVLSKMRDSEIEIFEKYWRNHWVQCSNEIDNFWWGYLPRFVVLWIGFEFAFDYFFSVSHTNTHFTVKLI